MIGVHYMYIIENIAEVCNNLHDWVSGLNAIYTTRMYEVFFFVFLGKCEFSYWGTGNFVVGTLF